MMNRLKVRTVEAIREIVGIRCPQLLPQVDRLQKEPYPRRVLSKQERERILDCLIEEFMDNLCEDYEPTDYGCFVDDLIGLWLLAAVDD